MNLNLRQLEAFVLLARLGGFSRAAVALHISQAGLSILIAKLEERVGARLVERTTRSMALTPAGSRVLPIAERVLADAKAIVACGQDQTSGRQGRISLGLAPLLAETVLPEVLKHFRYNYPNLSVRFRECANDEIVGRLYSREIEFGLAFSIAGSGEIDSVSLLHQTLVLACAADHPLASKRRVVWSDLHDQALITLSLGSTLRALTENALMQAGQSVTFTYEVTNALTAVALAREGLGVAIVDSSIGPLMGGAGVVLKVLYRPLVKRSLDLITRRGTVLSAPAQAFVRSFTEAMARRAEPSASRGVRL